MCTVTWLDQPGGYHLLCNRDEKRTRSAALGPQIYRRNGVQFVCPVDGDFGGTWIAVNEFGVSACLLNREDPHAIAKTRLRSRGLLLPELITAHSADSGTAHLLQMDVSLYAPFTMLLLEPSRLARVIEWDGSRLNETPSDSHAMPLTSSSYDPSGVRERRRREFTRRVESRPHIHPAELYRFHSSHGPQAGAYSPCMHRVDAETVSFSWVIITPTEIRFFYSPAAPCRCTAGHQQFLQRAA
jgi:hypothetical protein